MEKHAFYREYGKRTLDIIFSLAAIIILSPLLLILLILVRIMHGSPVLFSPTRPGKDEKIFHIYKFRTMSNAIDKNGILLPEADRVTKLGRFMRAASLDELPELFNILKGDMSIVGPRPLAKNSLPAYPDRYRDRFKVSPGLTGLAQINGRNGLDWNTRYEYDLEYIEKVSFLYDVKIIAGTVLKLFKKGEVTIPGTTDLLTYNAYRRLETEGKVLEVTGSGRRPEIGGGFSLSDDEAAGENKDPALWLPRVSDSAFTLAGRGAIELALTDIAAKKRIRTALVPSYLSFGMLQPFIEKDIRYEFYDVSWNGEHFEYKIDAGKSADVVLITTYYGVDPAYTDEWIRRLHKKGCIVIEDITHMLLSKRQGSEFADYYTASLRKWFALPSGGWIGRTKGKLKQKPFLSGDDKTHYVTHAMRSKEDYLTGKLDKKQDILIEAENFETWLVLMDAMTKIDTLSLKRLWKTDIDQIRKARIRNAGRLFEKLGDVKELTFLQKEEDLGEHCPLGVPVLVAGGLRNDLAKALAEEGIFCHVNWAERMGADAGIRDSELTLVCDQRYDIDDMDRTASVVHTFFRQNHTEKSN